MKTLKNEWIIWIIIIAPFIFAGLYWDKFPEQIATHFGADGKPNDYSSKLVGLIMLPGINVLMYFLFIVLPKIDPRKKNYELFADKFIIIRFAIHAFMSFIFMTSNLYALGYNINITYVVLYAVMVLFLIMGNLMGNVRPNFFVGIRTPWTLANEEVWVKTHRITAKIWVFGTLIMMVALPFLPNPEIPFLVYVSVLSVVPIAYSYILYKKIDKNN